MFYSRGKNKIANPYTLPDMYKKYLLEFPEGNIYYIEYKTFVKLNEEFYKRITNEMLNYGVTFKLPFRMGSVKIIKRKINYSNKLAIDWENTNKYGKKIYHLNDHTEGYKYLFKWDKTSILLNNKSLYRLVFTRANKRTLAKLIKSGMDYYEHDK
jgi:hypothetical protein